MFLRSSIKLEDHMDRKIDDFNPILRKITRLVAAIKSLRFALFLFFWIAFDNKIHGSEFPKEFSPYMERTLL